MESKFLQFRLFRIGTVGPDPGSSLDRGDHDGSQGGTVEQILQGPSDSCADLRFSDHLSDRFGILSEFYSCRRKHDQRLSATLSDSHVSNGFHHAGVT